jgi:hypothetical protein
MIHPYVRVHCRGKYWPFSSDVLYRQFHALALPPTHPKTQPKIVSWKEEPRKPKPPNVVIVGIDSMSRLSFHRTMPKTKKVLEEMGAIEMLGYTKGQGSGPRKIQVVYNFTHV